MNQKNSSPWVDKVKSLTREDPSKLIANPQNWRVHPNDQLSKLRAVIERIGFIDPLIQNDVTGHLINGHARCELAVERGAESIPVIHVDLTQEEEDIAIATFDPISGLAVQNDETLMALVSGIEQQQGALAELLESLVPPVPVNRRNYDPKPKTEQRKELLELWKVQSGQRWEIPSRNSIGDRHVVICGDSLLDTTVDSFGMTDIAMIWADPPYGIALDAATTERLLGYFQGSTAINADDAPWDERLVLEWIGLWETILKPGGYLATWVPFYGIGKAEQFALDRGLIWLNLFSWVKPNGIPGFPEFLAKWSEHCCIFRKSGKGRYISEETVADWAIQSSVSGEERKGHPSPKPVQIMEPIIQKLVPERGIVVDPFAGTGSTMVACENIGRICVSVEIDPGYCAVMLQRMADMDLNPELVSGKAALTV